MKLNNREFSDMNSGIRRFSQKHIEFRKFVKFIKKHNITLSNAVILDAGCGSGYSSNLIYNTFHPQKLISFDFMPEQIELAKKNNPYAIYYVDDVSCIQQPEETFDAVFVFGILHHVPKWKEAINELNRVIKKGGYLFIEEVNDKGVIFADKYLKYHHPKEGMFTWNEFSTALRQSGFSIEKESKLMIDYYRSFLCKKI